MIPADLLALLRCPETRQPVALAESELLARVNARISANGDGALRNRAGEIVAEALNAALVRADHAVLYPVRDGIPILLAEEAIPI